MKPLLRAALRRMLNFLGWVSTAPLRLFFFICGPLLLTALAYVLYSPNGGAILMQVAQQASRGAISARTVSGPLTGPLIIDGLVYEDRFVHIEADHAEIDWNLYALAFRQLRVLSLKAGQLTLRLKETPPNPVQHDALTHLPLALVIKQAQVQSFVLHERTTTVTFNDIALAADWSGDDVHVDSLSTHYGPLGTLTLKGLLRMEPRQLRIVQADIGGYGQLRANGVIGYHNQFSLDAQWQELRWPQAGEPQAQSASGRAHAEGGWDAWHFNLDGEVHRSLGAGTPAVSAVLNAQGRGGYNAIDIDRLQAHTLKGSVTGQARVAWHPQIEISAKGVADGLDPSTLWPLWPGRIGGGFEAGMRWPGGVMAADFQLALKDSQLRGYAFSLDTQGSYQAQALSLARFDLRSGTSRMQLQGRVSVQSDQGGRASAPTDLKANLDSPDLGMLWPQLKGSAKLDATLAGPLDAPRVTAVGKLSQIHYGDFSAEQVTLDADLHPQKSSHLDFEVQKLIAGIQIPSVKLHGEGTAAHNTLDFKTRTEGGDIELGLRGAFDLKTYEWSGQLVSGRGMPQSLPGWTLQEPADLSVSPQVVALEPACWLSNSGRACVQLHRRDNVTRLAFRLEDWAFGYFKSFMPPQWALAGSASGTGLLVLDAGGLREAAIDIATTAGQLTVGKQVAMSFEPSTVHAGEEAEGLVFQMSVPMQDGGGIQADAHLGASADLAQRPLRGHLRMDFSDLTPLRMLTPEIESVGGHLNGQFTLSGSAIAPRAEGALRLTDGSLRLASLGIELKPLQAELRSSAASNLIEFSASATSGGGELKLEGQTDPMAAARVLSLSITGDQFQALNIPQARVWVSPKLRFDLARERADLTGEVLVPRADILPRSFARGISPSRDQIIVGPEGPAPESGLIKIYSKVRVALGDEVRFEGFGLKTRLEGAIDVSDEPSRPTSASGEVRLVDGKYKAYGQDLTIETGRLIYNGGLVTDPAIELRAVRKPTEDISVGIYARGSIASPEFTLFSTPDMPQDQQLSWLVLGRQMEESNSTLGANSSGTATTPGEGSAMSNAALSLGVSGGSYLAQKLGSPLKLDDISIASQPGQTTDQAQFTIGKYLSPRLYMSYGVGVFQPGHSFRLLYDITKHIKLSTESGVESGGDLLYSTER